MPRTAKNVWPQVAAWTPLVEAYHRARKGKKEKPQTVAFHRRWEEGILHIQEHLRHETWTPLPMTTFPVFEPKHRIIEAPHFADRIVHHALVGAVEPHFERRFSAQSFACRKGYGIHRAVDHVQHCLRRARRRWGKVWVLQIDMSKYFPSIRHETLLEQFNRTIGCPPTRRLFETCIRGLDRDRGLPIGALTSQLAGNVYLDPLDHWVQDEMGFREYARYMDDAVMLGPSKEALYRALRVLRELLGDLLGLTLSKAMVYPAKQGVDFAGYRSWATHRLPRRRNVDAARKRLNATAARYRRGDACLADARAQVASLAGYLGHCDARRLHEQILDDFVLQRQHPMEAA